MNSLTEKNFPNFIPWSNDPEIYKTQVIEKAQNIVKTNIVDYSIDTKDLIHRMIELLSKEIKK